MSQLFEIQKWFGAMISQPLKSDHKLPKITPFETDAEEEACKYIAPSPTLKPCQRIELYHQQYWWRLLKCLQVNFPSLVRLYDPALFNEDIGVPYLSDNPPSHWALNRLGQTLPLWLKEKTFNDLTVDLAEIDAASQRAFWAKEQKAVPFEDIPEKEKLNRKITLQAHVHLFYLERDLFTFRDEILKQDPSYWTQHPYPEIQKGQYHFALYRNPKNQVKWKMLMRAEYYLLTLFRKSATIQEVCDSIGEKGEAFLEEAGNFLPLWFREWTCLKWLSEG